MPASTAAARRRLATVEPPAETPADRCRTRRPRPPASGARRPSTTSIAEAEAPRLRASPTATSPQLPRRHRRPRVDAVARRTVARGSRCRRERRHAQLSVAVRRGHRHQPRARRRVDDLEAEASSSPSLARPRAGCGRGDHDPDRTGACRAGRRGDAPRPRRPLDLVQAAARAVLLGERPQIWFRDAPPDRAVGLGADDRGLATSATTRTLSPVGGVVTGAGHDRSRHRR